MRVLGKVGGSVCASFWDIQRVSLKPDFYLTELGKKGCALLKWGKERVCAFNGHFIE